jgi:hypothetical protein
MGTWGYGLFSDDCAADVRDDYKALLRSGRDGPAATDELLLRWKETVADPDDKPVFWLALAVVQHQHGRLEDRVRTEAMAVLDSWEGLERWREGGERALRRRREALEKIRAALLAPQPPAKKIRPPFRDTCVWAIGELVAYQLASGRWIVWRVVGHETHPRGIAPVCELLDWIGDAPPATVAAGGYRVRTATILPWPLAQLLARNDPASASDPARSLNRLLAQIGLIDPAAAEISPTSVLRPEAAAPPVDWAAHFRAIEKAVDRIKAGDPGPVELLREVARERMPGLLAGVTQVSLRRELSASELPKRRVVRLHMTMQPSPAGEWLAVRWYELDEVLKDFFDVQ